MTDTLVAAIIPLIGALGCLLCLWLNDRDPITPFVKKGTGKLLWMGLLAVGAGLGLAACISSLNLDIIIERWFW